MQRQAMLRAGVRIRGAPGGECAAASPGWRPFLLSPPSRKAALAELPFTRTLFVIFTFVDLLFFLMTKVTS